MSNPTLGKGSPGVDPDTGVIDALIPPPWSPTRRLALTGVAVALVAGAVFTVQSGLFGPQLDHAPSWGYDVRPAADGTLVAERLVPIRNAGMLAVDLQELALPPIDGLTWLDVEGIPTTLAPGEQIELTVAFEVRDCALDVAGLDAFPILARSGIAPARVVDVPAPFSSEPEFREGATDGSASEELQAAWSEQPPSWVLETIAPICLDPEGAATSSTAGTGR